jgi:hypothetical protein
MGNKCTWEKKEEQIEVQFNAMTDEKKIKGKVILSFLYINLFRKKLRDLHIDVNSSITISKFFKTAPNDTREDNLRRSFKNLILDCNEVIQKCKLNEFNIKIDEEKNIDKTVNELVIFYTFEINKNLEALQKLIFGNEKIKNDDNLSNLISHEVFQVFQYQENISKSKILMNYINMENRESLPLNLRKFINKFLFLRMMSNMNCLRKVTYYAIIDKEQIQCILQNAKNLMKQKNEDIISENYGEVLRHVRFNLTEDEKEDEPTSKAFAADDNIDGK